MLVKRTMRPTTDPRSLSAVLLLNLVTAFGIHSINSLISESESKRPMEAARTCKSYLISSENSGGIRTGDVNFMFTTTADS